MTLGLDEPIPLQYVRWLKLLLSGDLGMSIHSNQPVLGLIASRVEPTLWLTATTIIFSIVVGVPLGVLAAWKQGTWIDRAVMVIAVLGFSIPLFVLGYGLIYGFSMTLRWLPVQGFVSFSRGFWPFITHLMLPTLTLGMVYIALITRVTRASMLEVLGEDYVRTARAKGVGERSVMIRHVLRNAAVPIISIIGIGFALLISGAVVTESVFNLPGLGRLTVDAVMGRDYPVIQGLILVLSLAYVLVNLAVDIAYVALDPRIRL
jgi:peptide/nickel transport system permease protein